MNLINNYFKKIKQFIIIFIDELWSHSMLNSDNWTIFLELKIWKKFRNKSSFSIFKNKKKSYFYMINLFLLNYKLFLHDFLLKSKFISFIDYFLSFLLFNYLSKNLNVFKNIIKVQESDNKFFITYFNNLYKNKLTNFINFNSIYWGLSSVFNFFKLWILPLFLSTTILYFLLTLKLLPISKYLFLTISLGSFIYLLISGFVFFIKKYQYNKFTSAIQRFWRRTFIIFWLIEGYTFLIFFYLTLNSSAEPHYMYDSIQIYKTHLFSWRFFIQKTVPLVILILFAQITLISLKWSTHSKISYNILFITILLFYIIWLEFYQFYYLINFYQNQIFSFDFDLYIWNLDVEIKKTRVVNHYVLILMILKFWHLVFVFCFWFFFVLRTNEIGRSRYPLLSANLQNFIIIYIMSWIYMFPWIKFIFRKYYNHYYYWFFVTPRQLRTKIFFTDLKLFYYSFRYNYLDSILVLFSFNNFNFFYWNKTSSNLTATLSRKQFIKDFIINEILKN